MQSLFFGRSWPTCELQPLITSILFWDDAASVYEHRPGMAPPPPKCVETVRCILMANLEPRMENCSANRRHFLMSSMTSAAVRLSAGECPRSCESRSGRGGAPPLSPSCSSIRTGSRLPSTSGSTATSSSTSPLLDRGGCPPTVWPLWVRGRGTSRPTGNRSPTADRVEIADVEFANGKKSLRLHAMAAPASARVLGIYVDAGQV